MVWAPKVVVSHGIGVVFGAAFVVVVGPGLSVVVSECAVSSMSEKSSLFRLLGSLFHFQSGCFLDQTQNKIDWNILRM